MDLSPETLNRYRKLLLLLLRHRPGRLIAAAGGPVAAEPDEDERAAAESFASDLEDMGPCFIKLGQLLAARPDLMPAAFVQALERLTDSVEPFDSKTARAIIEKELGASVSKIFATFEERPLASASLGQVHRATLRDGREVVVKVQREDVRKRTLADLDALDTIAAGVESVSSVGRKFAIVALLRDFRRTLLRELDYREEAANMQRLAQALERHEEILVPQPLEGLCSERVLTMTYMRGVGLNDLSPVVKLEIDGERLARVVAGAYLQQILVDGFFHADPHPGNVLLTPDHKLALLDVGMVGYLDPRVRSGLVKLLLAISESRGHEAADLAAQLGEPLESFDLGAFRREVGDLVAHHAGQPIEKIQTGVLLLEITRLGVECGLRPATELALLGRTLSHLDGLIRSLDPSLDPHALIRDDAARIVRKRLWQSASPGQLFRTMLETNELIQGLPRHANRILSDLAEGQLEVRVRSFDERSILQGFQRVANRIATGLVLAALIVGAALTMSVPTSFRIAGYPGLSIILFLLAALGGAALLLSIFLRDLPPPEDKG